MHPEEMVLITQSIKEVNQIMGYYVGIVRSDLRLKRAWNRLDILYEETERLFKVSKPSRQLCELRNIIIRLTAKHPGALVGSTELAQELGLAAQAFRTEYGDEDEGPADAAAPAEPPP